ncbi:MAG: 4Fe-4S binding protein [Planctomycetes bacterium]|nr:4Fe-4S binding protein [Planctomycetota bacterium]
MTAVAGYFSRVWNGLWTVLVGMRVTLRYFFKPETVVTFQYPRERDPDGIPHRHRGIHFLQAELCIFCDKCVRACPVDCITLEGTRDTDHKGISGAVEGADYYARQGAKGALLTRFTIDYSKCLFCNLCCEPCPEDCIHMGPEWDFSGYSRLEMTKNLLTDRRYSLEDERFSRSAKKYVEELAARKKREKEEKKKAAPGAGAAKKPATGASPPEAAQ